MNACIKQTFFLLVDIHVNYYFPVCKVIIFFRIVEDEFY